MVINKVSLELITPPSKDSTIVSLLKLSTILGYFKLDTSTNEHPVSPCIAIKYFSSLVKIISSVSPLLNPIKLNTYILLILVMSAIFNPFLDSPMYKILLFFYPTAIPLVLSLVPSSIGTTLIYLGVDGSTKSYISNPFYPATYKY